MREQPTRDRLLQKIVERYCSGKRVLELGCGEGHQTEIIAKKARHIVGIDISSVALERAKQRGISNAIFIETGMLDISLDGYDVITAMECVYYLSDAQRDEFFSRLGSEHKGLVIFSAPIVGGKYFTHADILAAFQRNSISLLRTRNYGVRSDCQPALFRKALLRISMTDLGMIFLNMVPERFIQQKFYIGKCRQSSLNSPR